MAPHSPSPRPRFSFNRVRTRTGLCILLVFCALAATASAGWISVQHADSHGILFAAALSGDDALPASTEHADAPATPHCDSPLLAFEVGAYCPLPATR